MKRIRIICVWICIVAVWTMSMHTQAAGGLSNGEVYISYANFPDEYLRDYLRRTYDTDGDGIINADSVTVIDLNDTAAENLKGIELFENLLELHCDFSTSFDLDISNNQKLQVLEIDPTWLNSKSIDLSHAPELIYLDCSGSGLTRLDVSHNTKLKTLICTQVDGSLASLDLTNNPELEELEWNSAYKSTGLELDLSSNPNMKICKVGGNFKNVNLIKCTKLKELEIWGNGLEEIDISNNKQLEKLSVSSGSKSIQKNLDLRNYTKLTDVSIGMEYETINLSGNKAITNISVGGPSLKNLNLSGCTNVKKLYIAGLENRNLTNLDLSSCVNLEELMIDGGNNLTVSAQNCSKLKEIRMNIDYDQLKKITIPQTKTLVRFQIWLDHCTGKVDLSKISGLDYNAITDPGWNSQTKQICFYPALYMEENIPYSQYRMQNSQIQDFLIRSGDFDRLCEVAYSTHVQTYGWQKEVTNGAISGTTGQAKRLEGIKIEVRGFDVGVKYTTHVQGYGWMPWSSNGEISGTEGEAKRMEAIMIQLDSWVGYDIYYRVHAQSYGWLNWAKNGEPAGTAGYAKRLEAIQIVVVEKGEDFDRNLNGVVSVNDRAYIAKDGSSPVVGGNATSALKPVVNGADTVNVMYRTHVQTHGWQGWKANGQLSGTQGQAKRLEGICIKLMNNPYGGNIRYTTHVQTYGWQGDPIHPMTWACNGQMSGTQGQAKRLEAIRIVLTGEVSRQYDIYYRVHAQTFGWLDWAKNGEPAGTAGLAKRLEGIQIVLVRKGGKAPGSTERAYIEKK